MIRHFTGPDHETMTKIAKWTAKNAYINNWLDGHLLIYLNGKIALITPNHELWNLLNSQVAVGQDSSGEYQAEGE